MFADLALAKRIERAEAGLTTEIVGAVAEPQALVVPIGDGVAAFARPGSPMNKLIGAGLDGPLDPAALDAIEAAHAARGEPVRVELSTLADPATVGALVDRGYALRGFENVLALALARDGEAPAGIAVERVTPETEAAWARASVDGFAAPDGTGAVLDQHARGAIEDALADFLRGPGMVRYLARIDGAIAGAASARVDGGVLQLCGAATLPPFRRRGVQRALLEGRLTAARAAGCDLAVVTTAPGSQSQANMMRRGFALIYARAVLIRVPQIA